jgi:DNA-binding NarL/FixJ family response regulator
MNNIQSVCESLVISDLSVDQGSLDLAVMDEVRQLAEDQGCAQEEMVNLLLRQALHNRRKQDRTYRCWESLSQREKQVAALICTGLTGRQIAARLVLSPETIKTHVRHILDKFGLNSRHDFRNLMVDWDFSRWLMIDRPLAIADAADCRQEYNPELYPVRAGHCGT